MRKRTHTEIPIIGNMFQEPVFRAWSPKGGMSSYATITDWVKNGLNTGNPEEMVFSQYTGLRDKNNVMIFTGDIIDVYSQNEFGSYTPTRMQVLFSEDLGAFLSKSFTKNVNSKVQRYFTIGQNCEVVGDVFTSDFNKLNETHTSKPA